MVIALTTMWTGMPLHLGQLLFRAVRPYDSSLMYVLWFSSAYVQLT